MRTALSLSLLLLAIALLACQESADAYAVTFLSKSGHVLASGTIKLSSPLPGAGECLAVYRLKMIAPQDTEKEGVWFYRLFHGKEDGQVRWRIRPDQPEDWRYTFDFMPGMADANIVGNAPKLRDGKTTGQWSYAIEAGAYDGGTIELERK
jgi:hypothetical protein